MIASINGSDFVVAVTEPTPSALHDLKRVLHVTEHFGIPRAIIINKSDLHDGFRRRIEAFARKSGISVIGKIPYRQSVVEATVAMKPVNVADDYYERIFSEIAKRMEGMV